MFDRDRTPNTANLRLLLSTLAQLVVNGSSRQVSWRPTSSTPMSRAWRWPRPLSPQPNCSGRSRRVFLPSCRCNCLAKRISPLSRTAGCCAVCWRTSTSVTSISLKPRSRCAVLRWTLRHCSPSSTCHQRSVRRCRHSLCTVPLRPIRALIRLALARDASGSCVVWSLQRRWIHRTSCATSRFSTIAMPYRPTCLRRNGSWMMSGPMRRWSGLRQFAPVFHRPLCC